MTLPPPRPRVDPESRQATMQRIGMGCALLIIACLAAVLVAVVWWIVAFLVA